MRLPLVKITFLFYFLLSLSDVLAQKHEWIRTTESSTGYVLPRSINTDSSSSVYVSGIYSTQDSIDFNTGAGKQMVYGSGNHDFFLLKLDSSGNFQWCNTFGSGHNDYIDDSHIDNKNNIFIAGSFHDTIQFNNSSPNATHISNGAYDAFVAKFDQDGQHIWSFSLGGKGGDQIHEVNTDSKNNIYLVGSFMDSVDMDPGTAEHFVYANPSDSLNPSKSFILKLDSTGSFKWVKMFDLNLWNIGINKYDHLFFSSNISDTIHISIQSGIETFIPKGLNDIIFGRMDSLGEIKWVNQLQSSGKIRIYNYNYNHPIDQDGNLHLLGTFSNTINLLNKPNELHHSRGKEDGFICKLDTSGNEIWFKTFGGKKGLHTHAFTIDDSSNLYVGIEANDRIDFQTDSGTISINASVNERTHIVKLNTHGNFVWAKPIPGGPSIEGISWTPTNDLYSTGAFSQIEFQDSVYYGYWTDLYVLKTSICDPIPYHDTLYLCAGDSSFVPNLKTEHAGDYSELVENDFGCDSLRLTHLVVYPSYPDTTIYSFCEGDSVFYQGNYYSEDTTFVYSATTILGCDSSKIVLIQKDTTTITEIIAQICEGNTFHFNSQTYSESGIHLDTLTAISGCDSIIQLNLTVNPIKYHQQHISICGNKFYSIGNSTYRQTGTYTDTLITPLGCDSIVTTILNVDSLPRSEQFVTMCQGGSYTIGNSTYGQAGSFTDTLDRFRQCDSIVTTHISIAQSADSTINVGFCEGDSVIINDQVYSKSGTFIQTMDFVSCQLKLTININVLPVKSTSQTIDLCVGDSIVVDNKLYFMSGTYYNTLQSKNGCDSIVQTTINIPEFNVVLDENSLTLNSKGNYENVQIIWYNCNSEQILDAERNERFEFKFSGAYAPIIIMENCRDTLICSKVTYNGDYVLKVFPNPAKDICTIEIPTSGKISLLNSNGRLMKTQDVQFPGELTYYLHSLASGMYFIVFEGEKGVLTEKLSVVR